MFFANVSGQQRSKQLAVLYKDERCQHLPNFKILEKMYVLYKDSVYIINNCQPALLTCFAFLCRYLEHIIRPTELEEFAAMLLPHQKATTSDGMHIHYIKIYQ